MKIKSGIVIATVTALLLFALNFFFKWVTGGFNNLAVWEWINRGFTFGLGLMASFGLAILILRLLPVKGGKS